MKIVELIKLLNNCKQLMTNNDTETHVNRATIKCCFPHINCCFPHITGCKDSCQGRQPGSSYPSYCGPCSRYFVCILNVVVYRYCRNNQCLIKDSCGEYLSAICLSSKSFLNNTGNTKRIIVNLKVYETESGREAFI